MHSSQTQQQAQQTQQKALGPFWHKKMNLTISLPSHMHHDSWKITKNYSPILLESAAAVWMDAFNEYLKGKKFIPITSHWKKWVTCTLKQWTDYKWLYWNTTLSSSTKKEPSCLVTTCQGYPRQTPMSWLMSLNVLHPFEANLMTSKEPPTSNTWTTFLSKDIGLQDFQNWRPIICKI